MKDFIEVVITFQEMVIPVPKDDINGAWAARVYCSRYIKEFPPTINTVKEREVG